MTRELFLAKKEITELTRMLYTEYKKVKDLNEQVYYLKSKLTTYEDNLETISERKLNEG
jgi:hypothetical protein|tara:strand:+ start:1398 stop:1574 length:177 start_codon:yes stop_codon:yes gene_type:complete